MRGQRDFEAALVGARLRKRKSHVDECSESSNDEPKSEHERSPRVDIGGSVGNMPSSPYVVLLGQRTGQLQVAVDEGIGGAVGEGDQAGGGVGKMGRAHV